MSAARLAIAWIVLSGCGFAAGHFRRTPGPVRSTTGTIVHQTCSGGNCSTTGTTSVPIIDKMSIAIGVLDGYGKSKITNDQGVTAEQSGIDLHVYLDYHYHLTPRFTLAIDGGIDLQNFDDDNTMKLGIEKGSGYLALGGIARAVFTTSPHTQVWFGGGYMAGAVDTIDASNYRANVGFHRALLPIGSVTMLLRIDAYAAWGKNDFTQQTVLGGFCFWFRPE